MTEAEKPVYQPLLMVYGGVQYGKVDSYNLYYRVTRAEFASGVIAEKSSPDPQDPYANRWLQYNVKTAKAVKKYMTGGIGMTYEVDSTDDAGSKIVASSAKYLGRWPNRQNVLDWQARATTIEAMHEAEKARKNATKFNAVRSSLEPIRAAYQALPAMQRPFFLAQVVDYMNRKGSVKEDE